MRSQFLKLFVLLLLIAISLTSVAESSIKRIYIMHFSHTDVGYTDMPGVTREQQIRYLDVAIDAVLRTMNGPSDKKLYWTCECMLTVDDWFKQASAGRKSDFFKALKSGQLEVSAMAFNQTPFLNERQWDVMFNWVSSDLWKRFNPKVAIQNDVNGFPRAGAIHLLNNNIKHLCMGTNSTMGGPPQPRPSAFWWKMPDGRKLFVYLNYSYPDGYDFFEYEHWRRGPVPFAGDTRYRTPYAGDFFRTDDESLTRSHQKCLQRLEGIVKGGYKGDELAISMTNHWRMDNDPPFIPLAEFVAAWNKKGLKPELVLTTAENALTAMERTLGPSAPEFAGEYTDWWANGTASAPREVAASRKAKRQLAAAESPMWGEMPERASNKIHELYKDLSLFDEHTWGSHLSAALPYSLDAQAQFAEKAMLAWRPMGMAELLLSQRARTLIIPQGEGLFVANPTNTPYSGWIEMPVTSLRGNFHSVRNKITGKQIPIELIAGLSPHAKPRNASELSRGNQGATFPDLAKDATARFWVDEIPAQSYVHFTLENESTQHSVPTGTPIIKTDKNGWPLSAQWQGMNQPLFTGEMGDFESVDVIGDEQRWTFMNLASAGASPRGDELRKTYVRSTPSIAEGGTTVEETAYTIVYTQYLKHPRTAWMKRKLEIWKGEPRARLTLSFDRTTNERPEIMYAAFTLPTKGILPTVSSGGVPFTPFTDVIPGACRDYFGIDGWANYTSTDGSWLWVSRDAPLVCLDSPQIWTRTQKTPEKPERIQAMLFNNTWFTNFVGNQTGTMEFQFDLIWKKGEINPQSSSDYANTLSSDPVVVINGPGKEDPIMMNRLFKP